MSVLTPSARWSSKPLSFTVKEGVNSVSVKLSKKAAALHNFLFSQRLGAESNSPAFFNLKLEDGTVILSDLKTSAGTHPSFVRDSKGGIYALYAEYVSDSSPKVWKMFFYDSEGKNPQEISLPSDNGIRSFAPVSDFTAGKTYAAAIPDASATVDGKLYRLDDGSFTRFTLLDSKTEFCAVDNNRLACIEKDTAASSQEPQVSLKIFTDISQTFQGHLVQLQASDTRNINEDIRIQGISLPNIRDIYVRGDYVYLLFSAFEAGQGGNGDFYSIGGLIRYKITQAGSGLTIGSAEKFGFNSNPQFTTVPGSSAKMLQNYDYTRCFYLPSMFIGFDEDHLYIADDGFDAKLYGGSSVGMKNKNRIAAFNIKTGSLSFENAPAGTKWLLTVHEADSSRYVKVPYENLEDYITTTASSTEINYIEITGTIPIGDFAGSATAGNLGKKIKKDLSKKIALKLPENITGLTDMKLCFYNCSNLVSLSEIPSTVTNMRNCFTDCKSLNEAPAIPSNVTNMHECFAGCKSLSEAPEIPSKVTNMSYCFSGCTSLTQAPKIHSNVTNMSHCFSGCTSLTQAPAIPSSVTNMQGCFSGCTSLTQAPEIPSSVKYMSYCFKGCTSLAQAPVIPESVKYMNHCFEDCKALETVKLECNYKSNYFTNVFKNCNALQDSGIKVKHAYYGNYTTSEALNNMAVPGENEAEKRAKFIGF